MFLIKSVSPLADPPKSISVKCVYCFVMSLDIGLTCPMLCKGILFYHQGCVSCINYPSNKLSFIRRVLNKSRTRNLLGQRLVVVSCVIFRGFYSFFCPICLMCKTFFKHVEDKNYVCHLIKKCSTAVSRKK